MPDNNHNVPKRSDQRRHRIPPKIPLKNAPAIACEPPRPNTKWHPIAKRWYVALGNSGQSIYYEASDWAVAYMIAENMSRELRPRYVSMQVLDDGRTEPFFAVVPMSGISISAYLRAMTSLVATEGDRRRAGIELGLDPVDHDAEAAVSEIDSFRARRNA